MNFLLDLYQRKFNRLCSFISGSPNAAKESAGFQIYSAWSAVVSIVPGYLMHYYLFCELLTRFVSTGNSFKSSLRLSPAQSYLLFGKGYKHFSPSILFDIHLRSRKSMLRPFTFLLYRMFFSIRLHRALSQNTEIFIFFVNSLFS